VLTVSGSGLPGWAAGGGGSPYTQPKLASFTIANTPPSGTAADTSTGIVLKAPSTSGSYNAYLLWDNTAVSGSTFTVQMGVYINKLNGNLGAVALCVGDATGKFILGQFTFSGGTYQMQANNMANSATSYNSDGTNISVAVTTWFMQIHWDGTNYYYYAGTDLNNMLLYNTTSASAFIRAPTKIGLAMIPYTSLTAATFFHYLRGA